MDVGYLSFHDEIPIFSSLLRELHINVSSLTECLYLLDGRLNQLRIFYVNIKIIHHIAPNIDMKKKLDNLRCFSLISKNETFCYSQSIVPLLHRMSNLKRLDLYLIIDENKFIDGNCLNNDIINHLPRLNHFIFNIQSRIYEYNQTDIRSNEDIQITFKTFPNHKVISCVDFFPEQNFARCHYYSYPYTMENYDKISNNFPGGLFKCVREISLFDERPFQHEFFIKISEAFPFLQKLTLENFQSQNKKSDEDDQYLSIIEYSYLTELRLLDVHDDYIEQFLFHSKSVLPNNISLSVQYDFLKRVTNHFTREQTRINSAKIKHVFLAGPGQHHLSKDFYQYFPNLQSYCFSLIT
ncbi:unnamed protein product [Rotaria sordida]|uniref:Uncharacterized protein n=1 Tax=Rotaria sordida TaxID=392033 RepID=A0A816DPM0_9BILA|nr:unnamed protein product [Rotaria sordida]CAF1637339.1 unnamed protein product [Rotaria sordida]